MGCPPYFHHHSRQEAPAKQDQPPWEYVEKLMETRVSVTLLSHLTSGSEGSSLGTEVSQSERHKIDVSSSTAIFTADLKL